MTPWNAPSKITVLLASWLLASTGCRHEDRLIAGPVVIHEWKADLFFYLQEDGVVWFQDVRARLQPEMVEINDRTYYRLFQEGGHELRSRIESSLSQRKLELSEKDIQIDRRLTSLRGDRVLLYCQDNVSAGLLQAFRDFLSREFKLVDQYVQMEGRTLVHPIPTVLPWDPGHMPTPYTPSHRGGPVEKCVHEGRLVNSCPTTYDSNSVFMRSHNITAVRIAEDGWGVGIDVPRERIVRFAWEATTTREESRKHKHPFQTDGDAEYVRGRFFYKNLKFSDNDEKMIPEIVTDEELRLLIDILRHRKSHSPNKNPEPSEFMVHLVLPRDDPGFTVGEFLEFARRADPLEDSVVILVDPFRVQWPLEEEVENLAKPGPHTNGWEERAPYDWKAKGKDR